MKGTAFKTVALVILLPFLVAGCADVSPTLKGGAVGAGVGAATGAAAGAIIDGGSGAGKGAAVGAIVGLVSGLLIGEAQTQAQKQQATAPRPPSESYSTNLPSPKAGDDPLLLLDITNYQFNNKSLAVKSMSLMKELLAGKGIKSEEYTIASSAKYLKSPVVALKDVRWLERSVIQEYWVTLELSRPDAEPKSFFGYGPSLEAALSQALFGK